MVPVRCFQCGMFVNHFQERFDAAVAAGHTPKAMFETLGIRRPCCRVALFSSADDSRLRRRLREPPGFAKVTLEPVSKQPYTLRTTGVTDAVEDTTSLPQAT